MRALQDGPRGIGIGRGRGSHPHPESFPERRADALRALHRAGGEGHVNPGFREQRRRPLAHRAGAREHHRLPAGQVSHREDLHDGRGGRGVAPVGVEHDRHAHRPEEGAPSLPQHGLAFGDIGATDEDGRVLQVGDAPCEHRPVDEIPNLLRLDSPILEQHLHARVAGRDGVEHAGRPIAVQLKQYLPHSIPPPQAPRALPILRPTPPLRE